jgi:CRP-like cAMP-binding protein
LLPRPDLARVRPHLRPAALPLGKPLYEAGSRMPRLYFVTAGIVSLIQVMADGRTAEIAVVGREGVVGIAMFMGGQSTPSRAVVQSEASALSLPASVLKQEFARGGVLHDLLLGYTQTLITQMSQTAVCNRHHTVEQQLCRWLLLSLDRLASDELLMTQELIANMLGVRRSGVAEAARKLQEAQIMRYVRGRISVLDRRRLEARACECYAIVKRETDRLFSQWRVQ